MREVTFEPPLALRQLAQITDFDLFVTTSFDPLLEIAVNLERFGGQSTAEVIAYAPNRVADLPAERNQLQRTSSLSQGARRRHGCGRAARSRLAPARRSPRWPSRWDGR